MYCRRICVNIHEFYQWVKGSSLWGKFRMHVVDLQNQQSIHISEHCLFSHLSYWQFFEACDGECGLNPVQVSNSNFVAALLALRDRTSGVHYDLLFFMFFIYLFCYEWFYLVHWNVILCFILLYKQMQDPH